jgi:hypothetical protein
MPYSQAREVIGSVLRPRRFLSSESWVTDCTEGPSPDCLASSANHPSASISSSGEPCSPIVPSLSTYT